MKVFFSLVVAALLCGCATRPAVTPEDAYFANLSSFCRSVWQGRLVSQDPQDKDMVGESLLANFRECSPNEVRIRFQVGGNASRNWVITRIPGGLRLKHVHLHEDGTEDVLSQYGGDSRAPGTATRQEFPADDFSKDLFRRQKIEASVTNVWAVEAVPGRSFAYELRRPGRNFRVVFDKPVPVVRSNPAG